MIVVLTAGTSEQRVADVLAEMERRGLSGRALAAGDRPLIHVLGGDTRAARALLALDQVDALVPTSGPRVRAEGRRFYPYHLIGLGAVSLLLLGVLVCLAGFFPPGVGAPIDPVHPAERPSELLPFLEAWLGLFPGGLRGLGWVVLCALSALVVALPWLDRTRGETPRERWLVLVLGGVLVALVLLVLARSQEWWS